MKIDCKCWLWFRKLSFALTDCANINFLSPSVNESSQNIKWKSNLWYLQNQRRTLHSNWPFGRDDEIHVVDSWSFSKIGIMCIAKCLKCADWQMCKWRIRDGDHTCCLGCFLSIQNKTRDGTLQNWAAACEPVSKFTEAKMCLKVSWVLRQNGRSALSCNVSNVPQRPHLPELNYFLKRVFFPQSLASQVQTNPTALIEICRLQPWP